MKTGDYWFRGFPALWNVIVLYLFVFPFPAWLVAVVVILAMIAMFVPLVFIHPMRVKKLRFLTLLVTVLWAVSALWLVYHRFGDAWFARTVLIGGAVYFLLLPLSRRSYWAREDGY